MLLLVALVSESAHHKHGSRQHEHQHRRGSDGHHSLQLLCLVKRESGKWIVSLLSLCVYGDGVELFVWWDIITSAFVIVRRDSGDGAK